MDVSFLSIFIFVSSS